MKKILLVIAIMCSAPSVWGACSNTSLSSGYICVQGGQSTTGTTSAAVTLTNHTSGNVLVLGVVVTSSTSTTTVSNTAGYSWTSAQGPCQRGTGQWLQVFYFLLTGNYSGSDVITASNSSGTFMLESVAEYSDTAVVFHLHGTGSCSASGGTAMSSGAYVVQNTDLAIGYGVGGTGTVGGAGWTTRETDGTPYSFLEDQVTSGTSATATGTNGQNTFWAIIGVAFGPNLSNPIISPLVPAINQGATQTFTCNSFCGAGGTWTCTATNASGGATSCAGSIVSGTGVYTAPATVTPQQTIGGYPLLPNNHIFNANVSAFPLRSDSATLMGGAGSVPISFFFIPVNYTNGSTPTKSMSFYYTPANNGTYKVPAYPGVWPTVLRLEGGVVSALANMASDHHFLSVDIPTGTMQEFYQYYNVGLNGACPSCNSQSGLSYANTSFALPASGSTDAAGLYIDPLMLRLQEMEQAIATSGTINHALRFTLQNGYIQNAVLWPGTTTGGGGVGGLNYYGERVRLKSGYNISGFSAIAQIVLTAMKNYGMILADGGQGWAVGAEYAKWPTNIMTALIEISSANISAANFDVVDESSFELSSNSGECGCNQETIVFTRTADSIKATTDVVLTGVAVNLPYDLMQIQVGAPAQTLQALVNIGAVTWTMSPTVGTIDSGTGVYTPPASVAVPTTTTVTATSTTNPAIAASMTINVFPKGVIRIVPGSVPGAVNYEMTPTTYTDTNSIPWYSIGDDGGYASSGSLPTVSGTSDSTLYGYPYSGYAASNDVRYDFIVPNGAYQFKFQAATGSTSAGTVEDLEVNGNIVYPNLDLYVASGGQWVAFNWLSPVVNVSNNTLSFVTRMVNSGGPHLGSLQISPGNYAIPAVMLQ